MRGHCVSNVRCLKLLSELWLHQIGQCADYVPHALRILASFFFETIEFQTAALCRSKRLHQSFFDLLPTDRNY